VDVLKFLPPGRRRARNNQRQRGASSIGRTFGKGRGLTHYYERKRKTNGFPAPPEEMISL